MRTVDRLSELQTLIELLKDAEQSAAKLMMPIITLRIEELREGLEEKFDAGTADLLHPD